MEAKELVKEFPVQSNKKGKQVVHAVSNVNLKIYEGETLALVGESGCGKRTLGRTLIRLLEATSGEIWFDGVDVTHMSERNFMALRRQMQIIFQDPYASLNPRMTVGEIIGEALDIHKLYSSKAERTERIKELLLHSSLKLNQIAEMVGYSDPKYMSKVFKEEVGMLPAQFRKQNH